MSNESERDLVALVAAEQRGFRNILYAGMATLVVLVLMSIALGGYYFYVSQRLNETSLELQRDAFRSRREMDTQSNRVADQGRRLRRMNFEMRRTGSGGDASADAAAALASARTYLMTGRLPYDDERLIEAVDDANTGSPAMQSLMNGVSTLISWERNGDSVAQDAEELPRRMQRALTSFESVRSDPTLAPLGAAGMAWVRYIETSSSLSNYAADDCNALIETVTASAENASIGPQPLWWRAQCERKMGHPDAALRDYAAALEQSYERALEVRTGGGGGGRNMQAELTLAMNAFHGVGTSLIALHDAPDSDANKAAGLDVARRACAIDEPIAQAPNLQLAEACLRIAVSLRQRIGQTPNQVSGSAENLGFVYLRDGNFQAAFDHAQRVERTGLFAWNELVRAISASHLRADPEARAAARRARRNVSFFTIGNFNLCEVRMLLNADLYAEADQLVRREHPDEDVVACAQS